LDIQEKDVLSLLKIYLSCRNEKILEEVIYCIGNIVSESLIFRNIALKLNILDIVVEISKNVNRPTNTIKSCLFLICNLLRGKPSPSIEYVKYNII
jgi:uncharacterized protein (UPF0218 family)